MNIGRLSNHRMLWVIVNSRKKLQFITLLTAILRIASHIENRKNEKGYIA